MYTPELKTGPALLARKTPAPRKRAKNRRAKTVLRWLDVAEELLADGFTVEAKRAVALAKSRLKGANCL